MDYPVHLLVRNEHELTKRSLRPFPEYDYPVAGRKSKKCYQPMIWARAILSSMLHLVTK
jgi:hypothetical protein